MEAAFTDLRIGGDTLDNRIVHVSHDHRRAPWGIPSPLVETYYTERSQGKSLTISEPVGISYNAGTSLFSPLITGQEHIRAWSTIANSLHESGGKIYLQLYHPGRSTTKGVLLRNQIYYYGKATQSPYEDVETVGPSSTTADTDVSEEWCDKSSVPRELSREGIAQIIRDFAISARNAKDAGVDGIEVNASDSSLVGQFIDPICNLRTDEYSNGLLFLREIVLAVSDIFPGKVGIYTERAITFEGISEHLAYVRAPLGIEFPLLTFPLIVGGVDPPRIASALDNADAISLSTIFTSNPNLRHSLKHDRPLKPYYSLPYGQAHGAPNYISFGRKLPLPSQVKETKHVAIIGAGPSGISSARAFLKFPHHKVDIFEKRDKAGGIWSRKSYNNSSASVGNLWNTSSRRSIPDGPFPTTLPARTDETYPESPIYSGLVTNVPQQLMFGFTAFKQKLDRNCSFFISGEEVVERVEASAEPYREFIRFNTSVEDVKNLGSKENPKYRIITKQRINESEELWNSRDYDFLIVAVGHNWEPRIPDVPGLKDFPGEVVHSATYSGANQFKGKRVLVVGTRESGLDIKDQLRPVASKIYLAQRSEHPYGRSVEKKGVELRGALVRVSGNKVFFSNDEKGEEVDAIILATGYRFHFPFLGNLGRTHPETKEQVPYSSPGGAHYIPGTFEHTFDIYSKNIAFVGPPTGTPFFSAWEKQAFVAALVFNRLAELPSREFMERWENERLNRPNGVKNAHQLLTLSDRALFLENLNIIASDYLSRPEQIDDELLRDWPREWTRILFDSVAFKKGQYEKR